MSLYGITLSAPITTDVSAGLPAYLDPATGAASNATTGEKCLGLFADSVQSSTGNQAPIQTAGVLPGIYGGATQYGDSLMVDATGRLATAAGASGTKVWCVGFALATGQAAGDSGDVLIHPHEVVIP